MKRLVIVLATAVLLGGALWFLQKLVVPKYITENEEGVLCSEYYDNAGGNDVLFIGDCEVYSNFSPITLWQDYGITSVIRGTPQQLIWHSYYMLEDTLRYETPKVCVYNVLSMKYDEPQSEAYNRLALDGMRWSPVKVEAVKASLKKDEDDTFMSYVFPILRFHSRWNELTDEDFKYLFKTEKLSHNGYVMRVDCKPVTVLPDPIPLPDYNYSDIDWQYLDKIRDCCNEHGIKLILIKSPSCQPYWFEEWDKQISDYAKANGLTYINFLEHGDETGIDYTKDTYDAGMHLNLSGAEKASRWFGKILSEQFGLPDHRSEDLTAARWDEKISFYEAMKASQFKQLEETGQVTSFR